MSVLHALRLELRGFLEYVLLPGLAVFMPWPLAYRLLKQLARYPGLYEEEWRPALAQALSMGLVEIDDPDGWAWRYRACRLVDHADFWLSRTRRARRWLPRHSDRRGDWPALETPAVGAFFHWCAGMWGVRALLDAGHHSSVLAGRFSKRSMGGARLGYWYGHLRLNELSRASGGPLIYAPGTVKQSLDALTAGRWVIGTPDVPPTETRFSIPVRLFGRDGHMPEGLLLIARQARVPVVVFTMALDFDSGRRELRIEGPFDPDDPDLMQRIADTWQALIREKSWAFTLWPAMPAYFAASNEQE
ncbi:MAG: hypothetical protein WCZ65_00750 [Lysobacteraceae bacterium]